MNEVLERRLQDHLQALEAQAVRFVKALQLAQFLRGLIKVLHLVLIVSLGSSSIIANIIAGYSIAYRRPFKVGDRVKINDTVGAVIEIRVLVTRLPRTWRGSTLRCTTISST